LEIKREGFLGLFDRKPELGGVEVLIRLAAL